MAQHTGEHGGDPAVGSRGVDLRAGLDDLPVALVRTEPDGTVEYLNRCARDALGAHADALLAHGWKAIVHPEDTDAFGDRWHAAARSGEPFTTEYRQRNAEGAYRWWRLEGWPTSQATARGARWHVILTDIDEHKRTLEALRQSEERATLIINAMPVQLWTADAKGRLTFTSSESRAYFGLKTADPNRWDRGSVVHPDDLERVNQVWSRAVAAGASYRVQCRHRRADGLYRWYEIRAEPLRDDQGQLMGWCGVNFDIDDSRRLESEAREAHRRLGRAAQLATVAELSASIAHEINQPLASVVSSAEGCQRWLAMDPPNIDRARRAAERINRDGMAAAEIVQRIRALFKRSAPAMAWLDVNDVILQVLEILKDQIESEGITVNAELTSDLAPVLADRVQIQQVISNLAQNAVDAMRGVVERPRQLVVGTRSDPGNATVIQISDSGEGLKSPERVFESFYTTKSTGMGMGLTICRSIIEAHGGRIWAEPNPLGGTTFSFSLPAPTTASS
jgi:PAS domain S-box-containing protein